MKALIVASFWRKAGHVGNYRIDRFVRWLTSAGIKVVLVRAGSGDGIKATDWGVEITVADPLKLHVDVETSGPANYKPRKANSLRRNLAYFVFNPDPAVMWARRAVKNPLVREHAKEIHWVISSSPPESCHVAASALAQHLDAKLIIDMRDGWLDEPLKPLLRMSRLQRWREGRLESSILRRAHRIFVTSDAWKDLLTNRLPFSLNKTVVLTNSYPLNVPKHNLALNDVIARGILLVHAGRFTASRLSHRTGLLLKPLYEAFDQESLGGNIVLVGDLADRDVKEVTDWQERFSSKRWNIEIRASVTRDTLLQTLLGADGLLLLSASRAAIPSKMFEYLAIKKPILAATSRDSAVWKVGEQVPQMYAFDYAESDSAAPIQRFLHACRTGEFRHEVPAKFSEETLSRVFLDQVFST